MIEHTISNELLKQLLFKYVWHSICAVCKEISARVQQMYEMRTTIQHTISIVFLKQRKKHETKMTNKMNIKTTKEWKINGKVKAKKFSNENSRMYAPWLCSYRLPFSAFRHLGLSFFVWKMKTAQRFRRVLQP